MDHSQINRQEFSKKKMTFLWFTIITWKLYWVVYEYIYASCFITVAFIGYLMDYLKHKNECILRKNIFGFITHHKYNYCLTILWRAGDETQVFKHAVPIDLTRHSVLAVYIFKGFYSPQGTIRPHTIVSVFAKNMKWLVNFYSLDFKLECFFFFFRNKCVLTF